MSGNAAFTNAYTVGKGRLFFSRFQSDDVRVPLFGLKYLGNTPSFTSERKVTTLDHYDSDAGQKIKDDSIDIQTEFGGKFTCDNITGDNLALFFGGTDNLITQIAGTSALTQTLTVEPDTYYQFGQTATNPTGNAVTGNMTITTGGTLNTPVASDGSLYNYDAVSGLLYATPAVTPGAVWTLAAELAQANMDTVVEAGQSIFGQLAFYSNNPKGPQRDFIIPYCKLSAEGEMPLKGDTWMTLGFTWEALQLTPSTRRVYIRNRPVSIIDPNGP